MENIALSVEAPEDQNVTLAVVVTEGLPHLSLGILLAAVGLIVTLEHRDTLLEVG